MISSSQIKAARAMLGWSALDLAEASGVGPATIRRYEVQNGIPSANTKVLKELMSALERGGIEFSGDPLVNPSVTLNIKKRAQLDD
jgi:transcriptional regulator with XRE-family HTH domain